MFKKVELLQFNNALISFEMGVLELYTKKNHIDFVRLYDIEDVKKYAYRLYTKET